MIFDDNVLCTRDRGPSGVGVEVSEVVLVLSAPQTLQATTEAKAVTARWVAVMDLVAGEAGRQAVETDQPARIPLEVAIPGAPEAQAGTLEVKPARVPAAQAATVWAKR
jgi:hypothetical protein